MKIELNSIGVVHNSVENKKDVSWGTDIDLCNIS